MGSQPSRQEAQPGYWLSRRDEFSSPNPEWEEFYAKNSAIVPSLVGRVEDVRQTMLKAKLKGQAKGVPVAEGLTIRDESIATAHGAHIKLRTYSPDASSTKTDRGFPAMLYFHGGGFSLGDLEGEDKTCRTLCVQNGIVVVAVDYRLAPENPHPAALEDAWDSMDWVVEHASELNVDTNRLLVGGTSAGANIAAVMANGAKERTIAIRGQLLRIPVLCQAKKDLDARGLRSMDEMHNSPILSRTAAEQFLRWYAPKDISDPTVSPLLAESLEGVAPAFLQVCGRDPLRDEGLAYADALQAAGVPVRTNVYPGVPHAFWLFPEVPLTLVAYNDLIEGVKWLVDNGTA